MADDFIPSISSGSVGSRFVSQSDLETAKARREEQWKAAYARYARPSEPNMHCITLHCIAPRHRRPAYNCYESSHGLTETTTYSNTLVL